jgi:hypothetical protein
MTKETDRTVRRGLLMFAMKVLRKGWPAIAGLAVVAIVGAAGAPPPAHALRGSRGRDGRHLVATATTPARAALAATTTYSAAGGLNGVAADADNNAWAVGYSGNSSSPRILMLHWNGRTWSSPGTATASGHAGAPLAVPHAGTLVPGPSAVVVTASGGRACLVRLA